MGASSDHWVDRLAVSLTRRQVVRGGLAAAGAVAALPLLRVPSARAAAGDACFTPCRFQGIKEHASAVGQCLVQHSSAKLGEFSGLKEASLGPAFLGVPGPVLQKFLAAQECRDTADMKAKAYAFNCGEPNCGGWDPKAPGGPCDTCTQYCCPCTTINPLGGYICCVYPCDDPTHNCCPAG